MPKQIQPIQEFHGGLSDASDARDISTTELSDIQDAVVHDIGKIRNMGGTVAHPAATADDGFVPNGIRNSSGFGLFAFSHDRNGAEQGPGFLGAQSNTDYLVMADCDITTTVYIYNFDTDLWKPVFSLGDTTNMRPVFYIVDGVLRVSDGNFGDTNANKWYGYIYRTLFKNISQPLTINEWHLAGSKCERPPTSYYRNGTDFSTLYGDTNTQAAAAVPDVYQIGITRAVLASGTGGALANVGKAKVSFQMLIASGDSPRVRKVKMRCGTAAHVANASGTENAGYGAIDSTVIWDQAGAHANGYDRVSNWVVDGEYGPGTYTFDHTFYFNSANTLTNQVWGDSGTDTNEYLICEIEETNPNINKSAIIFTNIEVTEVTTIPDLSAYLNPNNAFLYLDWDDGDGALWSDGSTAGKYMFGISHIYDEKQESQIRTLGEYNNVSTTTLTASSTNAATSPGYRLHIGMDNGYNKRVTGINLYMKDVTTTVEPWYLQAKFDLVTGVATLDGNQQKYNASYQTQSNENYYFWEIPPADNVSPSKISTYQINSGFEEEELSITSKYKTAVVVNRMVYIGNIQVLYEGSSSHGVQSKEIKGDAMLKSPVNQFDNFPLSRIIEASVQDGDEIIKLEEYADRILQFKKKKMHLINVSQNLEFLEDTFMHKGVAHPSATVKTDYGIAWVNENGAYLYDGQKVTDLLEKGGRQIINELNWASFIGPKPSVGYLPDKRQLIVLGNTAFGSIASAWPGDIYLLDLVTLSWTKGDSKLSDHAKQTNFVIDRDNRLTVSQQVYPFTTNSLVYWDDAADASGSGTYKLHTKDYDFGQPGQRKKIYKVYISYKGNGSGVTAQYAINGDNDTLSNFYKIAADGSSTKATDSSTPFYNISVGVDDWVLAELRPVSSINNVYSFQLRLGGTASSDFEINDMTIIYRLKNIK
tara:strand:+ start:2432 stop:5218 length:2787 start_codon:yes stop_codon:yes gene_type:complete